MTASEKELFALERPHGHGEIIVSWQRDKSGYLATSGLDGNVFIYNRVGQKCDLIKIKGLCADMSWDPDGDVLAIICTTSNYITLWDSHTLKITQIDTGLRDPLCCLMWTKAGQILAVGSSKGNLSIYNHNSSKRIPVLGKHSRKIICGAWNTGMVLGLCSEDKTISLSNVEGDTLKTITLRGDPSVLTFSEMKLDDRSGEAEYTVSVLVSKKTLFLYNLNDPDNPVELAFQPRYGQVVTYKWFDDGYILLGFSGGFFIAISTHMKEIGQELFQIKNHKEHMSDIALNLALRKVASGGDNQVKVHEMSNLQEVARVISLDEESSVDKISWSDDGQLLAITTTGGSVFVYLSKLLELAVADRGQIAVLTSLTEVSILNYDPEEQDKPEETYKIALIVEPAVIAVGPYHAAVAMNNLAYFYDLIKSDESGPLLMREQEYLSSITSIKLNKEYCSVLCESTIQIHMIEISDEPTRDEKETLLLPEDTTRNIVITCHALTNEFLIYGTDLGSIHYFFLTEWKQTAEMRHTCGIRNVYPDQMGRRVVVLDEKNDGYLFSAIEGNLMLISDFPSSCLGVMWDQTDKDIFIASDETTLHTFVHTRYSINGPRIQRCGSTVRPSQESPLLLNAGNVVMVKSGGKVGILKLATHSVGSLSSLKELESEDIEKCLQMQLTMNRFDQANKICTAVGNEKLWIMLAEAVLKTLNVDLAVRIYSGIGDVGMVLSLQSIRDVEDRTLLSAHIAMFLEEFDLAQELYLASGNAQFALDMRRDLLHWEQALQLAQNTAPDQIPSVATGYAQQLEFTGNYPQALSHYERGLVEFRGDANAEHVALCRAGVARTAIRCGDTRRGVTIASEPGASDQLKKDCAEILEEMKLLSDAAVLYEKGNCIDQAAGLYIQLKNWTAVGRILPGIKSSKIHLQYAKACETDKRFEDALLSYEKAGEIDSVIQIYLNQFNNPAKAVAIIQETYSANGAKLIATYFQKKEDYNSAIRFLIMSGRNDEAFLLAKQCKHLSLFGEILVSQLTVGEKTPQPQDFLSLAKHYEMEKDNKNAGKYFFYSGEYKKAISYLIQASSKAEDELETLSMCIDAVIVAKDDVLTQNLLKFFLGEVDGIVRDPKFIFRLYMAQKQYKDAGRTAIIIANDEQIKGNYRSAHSVLLGLYQELHREGLSISFEFYSSLALLHLYTLVRIHVRRGNHSIAARLLMKVAQNISKFPAHIVPILTSTVIECSRAGFKQAAFSYAAMLMRPEYRPQLDVKYARKMESIVRRPPKNDVRDPEEEMSPCPICNTEISSTDLRCIACKAQIPFCIATGRHIVKDDFTVCPHCEFPAIYSELLMLIEEDEPCPMCSEAIYPERLRSIQNIKPYLTMHSIE